MQIYNSISKKKEYFKPLEEGTVKLYVCGPTVYDRPHLGNMRSALVYDLLYRVLKRLYPRVIYVRNVTDIDDKIIEASKKTKLDIQKLTQMMLDYYNQDLAELNCLPPSLTPRATESLPAIFKLIQKLLDRGHAYEASGHILFDVKSYGDYGKLSRRTLEDMIAGSRIEVAPFKKNPGDFILWKPSKEKDESYSFESPWGRGRPGWHIECSAMSTQNLGESFDLHGGGVDLVFPHHENEIAQALCAHPGSSYATYWVHNGFLTVKGEKMSKSLNNFYLVRDLLDQGIKPQVIRYFYLTSHYRKPLDLNDKVLEDSAKTLARLKEKLTPLGKKYEGDSIKLDNTITDLVASDQIFRIKTVFNSLLDDLNTPKALAELLKIQDLEELAMALNLLGFKISEIIAPEELVVPEELVALAEEREIAKRQKNWQRADELRQRLEESGYRIIDSSEGNYKIIRKVLV